MTEAIAFQFSAAVFLGATLGLDRHMGGRRHALSSHTAAAIGGAGLVLAHSAVASYGLGIPVETLGYLASLSLIGIFVAERAVVRRHRHRDGLDMLMSLGIAAALGMACGLGKWSLVSIAWLEMLALYIGRMPLGTEPLDRFGAQPD